METNISLTDLAVYKALASPVRLQIIQLLAQRSQNAQALAKALQLSQTITSLHLKKLAEAGIIDFYQKGHCKMAQLEVDHIDINFPKKIYEPYNVYQTDIPVGQFTNFHVEPSCGMADQTGYIGKVDEPAYFIDPRRFNAGMIWWNNGYLEYQVPNHLTQQDTLQMIDIIAELGSEFPFSNNNWPSDITVSVNGTELGYWTSPGDFSDVRGKYTPNWVPNNVNQYGLQKIFRITDHGTYLDGKPWSDVCLQDLEFIPDRFILRFEIKSIATNNGGCTIFGKGFGNYNQDLRMKLFYS
ncbi:ArsR/SmtB family transcription factor [Limosilactobacillus ingluviei]|uniref:ArsR/SmtB family transcription factor n=1 Tax=Limosilactobacillus ingluviei TaxID=148604 RepID=UPI00031A11C6|nr:ArsR family transcriptional regulator [Limosilactobacillus ingluviei]